MKRQEYLDLKSKHEKELNEFPNYKKTIPYVNAYFAKKYGLK